MAKLTLSQNNNTIIAEVPVPDSALPSIRDTFGGVTNAETAAKVLAEFKLWLRQQVRNHDVEVAKQDEIAAVQTAETQARSIFDSTTWPEV